MNYFWNLLVIFITFLHKRCESGGTDAQCNDFPWSNIRLPLSIEPIHYSLRIHPNVTTDKFLGSVNIEINVKASTDFIVLHSKQLNINEAKVTSGKRTVETKQVKYCTSREQMAILLQEKLKPNSNYMLSIKFTGQLSAQSEGLYKTGYKNAVGQQRYAIVTHFEPTSARAMFPCWDEPSFKAHFTLTAVRQYDMFTLSNMDLASKKNLPNGLVEDTFQKSVVMSTYLLALVISDYQQISSTTSSSVKVSVYTPPSQIKQGELALKMATKCLDFYETFFKIKYPLKKYDQISLNDFTERATENFGLVSFRDSSILYDPQYSDVGSGESVATTVCHEASHQWFGNLVTIKWWNDLWLKEAVAVFFQTYATSQINPDWNLMARFFTDITAAALQLDGLMHTHPVSLPVTDPTQINSLFDDISYNKGSAVIRMVVELIGIDNFRNGISDYLSKYLYSNAEGKDFWNAINKFATNLEGLSLLDFTTQFIEQPGYPIVYDEYLSGGKLRFHQTRFFFSKEEMQKAEGKQLWYIPLTITTDTGKKVTHWMKREKQIEVELKPEPKWFKVNDDSIGYYRVNYDEKNWKALIKQLLENHEVFSPLDRAGLLNDVFTLFRIGMLDVELVFELIPYLTKETSIGPYSIAEGKLTEIDRNLQESHSFVAYRSYMKNLFTPMYKKYGWQIPSNYEDKLVHRLVISLSCYFEVEGCKAQAIKMFQDYLHKKTKILPDYRNILCMNAIGTDPIATWDAVYKLYKESNVPSEKLDYLKCLGFTNNPERLNRMLEMSLNSAIINPTVMPSIINAIVGNSGMHGRCLFWQFFQRKYEEMTKLFSPTVMSSLIATLGSYNTQNDYDEINAFFKDKHLGESKPAFEQVLERISSNIQFLKLNENKMAEFLKKKGYVMRMPREIRNSCNTSTVNTKRKNSRT